MCNTLGNAKNFSFKKITREENLFKAWELEEIQQHLLIKIARNCQLKILIL